MDIGILRTRLVHVFKNWKLLFKNFCGNTCGWKSVLKYVKCCLKTENCCLKILTKHPLVYGQKNALFLYQCEVLNLWLFLLQTKSSDFSTNNKGRAQSPVNFCGWDGGVIYHFRIKVSIHFSYIVHTVRYTVAILRILSRVFQFYFEKISGYFGLFRNVLINTDQNSRFDQHEICALKKKMFVKPKQICILYTKKP